MRICFIVFFISLCSVAMGKPLMLTQVLASTKKYYPQILVARQQIRQAEAKRLQAQGAFDPQLQSSLAVIPRAYYENNTFDNTLTIPLLTKGVKLYTGYKRGRGDYPSYYSFNKTLAVGEVRAGVSWPLLQGSAIDKARVGVRNAATAIDIEKLRYQMLSLDVFQAAVFSYLDWLSAGEKLILKKKMLMTAKKRQEIIDHRFKKGDAAATDVIENESLILQRKSDVVRMQSLLQQAAWKLALYHRGSQGEMIIADAASLPMDMRSLLRRHLAKPLSQAKVLQQLQQHPALQVLREQKHQARLKIRLSDNQLLPQLDANVFVDKDFGGGDIYNRETINLSLRFSLPLYRRVAKGKLQQQKLIYRQLSIQENLLLDQLRSTSNKILLARAENKSRLKLAEENVVARQKLAQAEAARYFQGDSNLFLVNQREIMRNKAQMSEIDIIISYLKTHFALLASMGTTVWYS